MKRPVALVIVLLFLGLFAGLGYYGAHLTTGASIMLGLLVSLIFLNLFYPPGQMVQEDADFTLALYGLYQTGGLLALALYLARSLLVTVRPETAVEP
jgi:hypothetical protein